MTVSELINKLQTMPQDVVVVMSRDSEGNGYSPASEVSKGRYAADSTWTGWKIDDGDSEWAGEVPAVFLFPTN